MKIVISELATLDMVRQFQESANVVMDEHLWQDEQRLLAAVADADALIVRNKTQVTAKLLRAARSLKVIGRLGVGLDNIDVTVARELGVPVISPRGANATAVAEYVFAAVFTAARRLSRASESVKAGRWDRAGFTGMEVAGKTLGIVGLGDIGVRLAYRARAFGMQVLAADPVVAETAFPVRDLGVSLVSLPQLLREADFISLHVPLVPATRHLMNEAAFRDMKPTAWLINTSRGGVIDEQALEQALRTGRPGGAVLDVRAAEPPGPDDPLARLENVILTPHVAGLTQESQALIGALVAKDVLTVLAGGRPAFAV